MLQQEWIIWTLCIFGGFLMGSIMFSQILPKVFLGKDIIVLSPDHNPGATNVFTICGPLWGSLCLCLDILKGFLPVAVGLYLLDAEKLWFAAVLAAPVLGHALAPVCHFRGGKCIATAFGALLGLIPHSYVVAILAVIYITFSTVLKISPNRVRSIASFGLFGILSAVVLTVEHQYSVAVGCMLISLIAIWRHSRYLESRHCTIAAGQEAQG